MNPKNLPLYNQAVLPYHFLRSGLATLRAGRPARKLRVIGVTGTNGKTTTSFLIWKMLNTAGHKTGLMTTVAWGVDKLTDQIEHMTTVSPELLNKRIKTIADSGAEFLVLEVTSHALAQFRTLGIPIEIAVMTNVTHEHLDYHRTFTRYRDAKRKLFRQAKFGIINADDPSAKFFQQSSRDYITYGIKHGKIRATDLKLTTTGTEYIIPRINNLKIRTQIAGEFNVYNSLAAALVGQKLGLTNPQIATGIAALDQVDGRMANIAAGQPFAVIVDFAHTPDAMQKVYDSLPKDHKGRIISVFGGAGRRDIPSRAMRGAIAARYSDIIIATEDDSRDEDPAHIISQIAAGAAAARDGAAAEVAKTSTSSKKSTAKSTATVPRNPAPQILQIISRPQALEKAFILARSGDIVLLLGKGHEKTILRADGSHPYYEPAQAKKILQRMFGKK